jgi:hypothetical protein
LFVGIGAGWVLDSSHHPGVEPFGSRQNRTSRVSNANVLQLLLIAGSANR